MKYVKSTTTKPLNQNNMNGKCFNCNYYGDIHMHHVVPKSLGGINTVPLCIKCHGIVHGRDFVKSRNLQRIGIEKAKMEGKYKNNGRKEKESFESFIKKKKVKEICVYRMTTNYSYRDICTAVNCSLGLVVKVHKVISDDIAEAIAKQQEYIKPMCKKEVLIKKYEAKINKLMETI
jgi:hypothetical protein